VKKNDVWYQFTVQTSGNLAFSITPNTLTDDYDWAVYNLTNNNCADIYSNAALEVSCNFSGTSGVTGPNGNAGIQNEAVIPVVAGQTYVVNVSQFSTSTAGYNLNFGASTASIFDNVPPRINSLVSTPTCGATSFSFNMSENVLCSTVSTGDFTLAGPGGPYTVNSIIGSACAAGGASENTFTINTTPAITTAGTYSLCLVNTAGSVTDLCGNAAAPACFNFTIAGPTVAVTPTNPPCASGTGSIAAVGSGGSGTPFTYSLNGGAFQASGNFTGLAAGTYTVRTQDAGGCRGQNTAVITIPTPITVTLTPTPSGCAGTGSITSTVAGGTGPYTYAWSPSGTGANPTGLAPNTYSVTVTGVGGCTATATTTVTAAGSVSATFNGSPNQCLNTNSFTFTNTGTAAATHAWTFPSGTPASSAVVAPPAVTWAAAGTYTVTHTVTSGTCTATNTVQVTVFPRPNGPALTPVHPKCGTPNGAVNVTAATGGTPAYLYNLNGGANTTLTNYTGQAAGTYTVNVTDANGCTNSSTLTLTNVPGPTALALTPTNAHCGQADGSIAIGAVTGGTSAYSYSFNNPGGPFTAISPITGQLAGTYSVTVRDINLCVFTQTVTIGTAALPTGPNATSVNSTCGNANGTVTLAPPTTGTGAFTYSFNGGAFSATTNYTALAANTYTYVVRDVFGCPLNGSITVNNTAGPTAVTLTPVNASCGANNGSFTIGAVTGGTSAYTYSVSPGPAGFNATTNFTTLAAGTYTVIVRDANACTYTSSTIINNTGGPTAVVLTPVNSNCGAANGSFTIGAVTGGTGAITYSVSPGPAGFNATTSFTGLAANTYTVIVRDANGCTFTSNTTVGNNPGPTAMVLTPVNATCGTANGSFTIGAVTGGGGTNTYSVSPGPAGFNATTSFTGLAPNTYTVIVRDVNGCTFASNTTIGNTAGPTAVALTPVNSTCGNANGSFNIGAVTGGTSAYTYSVSPGPAGFTGSTAYNSLTAGTFTVTVRDANACTYTTTTVVGNTAGPTAVALTPVNTSCGGTTGTLTIGAVTGGTSAFTYSVSPGPAGFNATTSFTGLGAATYTVIVQDANGCQTTSTSVVGNNPGPTAVVLTPVNSTCGASNGSFTIGAVTGGTGGYTYSVNASAFTATTNYTALAAGTYTVIVRDVNGCTFTSNTTINNTGAATAVVLTPVNTSCGGSTGSFTIGAVTGGVGAFTYSVTPGPAGFNATTNFTGLAANTYTVVVQGSNGCLFTSSVVVGNNPGPTAMVLTPVNATCGAANGSFTIGAVTGGGGTNTYSVSPGPAGFNATTSFTGLAPNTYTVIVRDVNGCTFTSNTTIGNTAGPTAVALTPVNSTCGNANGSFTIGAVTGGTSAYTYSVSPGPAGFTGTVSYTNLAAGTFTVTVRDASACTFTTTTVVGNTAGPTALTLTPVNTSCGGTTGTLTIGAVTGGTSAYTYSVSPGPAGFNATTSFTGLGAATYTVIVQDANGCQFTQTSVVGNNPAPTAVVLTPVSATCGASNGSFTIGAVTGGTAGFTYSVNASAFTATTNYTALAAGTYTVVVQDANGCQFTSNTTVNNSGGPTAVVLTPVDAACGLSNGSFTIGAVTGGAGGNVYSVNGSAFTATTSYIALAAGTYTVVVRDANNCTFTSTTVISNSGGPTAQVVTSTNSACSTNTGTVTFGATTGGTGIMTYSFDGSAFTGTTLYSNVAAGTYNAIVRDGNGCQFATTVTVGTVAGPTDVVLTPTNSTCGSANGSFTIGAVTGGGGTNVYSINGGAFTATTSYTAQLAGTYTVVVRDVNGCTYTENVTITNTPGPTAFAVSSTNSTCGNSNGVATAGAVTTSGSTVYQYSINGGALGATTSFTGLAAATYTLLVQDANGCQLTNTVTVANTPGPTAQVLTPVNSTCGNANGTVTIGATTGGTGLITYSFNGSAFSGTTSYTSLAAGTYTVVAQDANNCQFTQTTVVSNLPGPTALALTTISATCGGSNGVVNVGAVTGGSGTNTYSFNGSPFTATVSYPGLIAGTYTVVVQDVNLCQFTQTVSVNNSGGPSAVALTPTNSTCGNPNGSIAVGAVTGGAGTITYSLNGGAFSSSTSYTGLTSGTYTVTVSDVNACTFAQTVFVDNTAGPTAVALTPTNSTCGNANGSFVIGAVTGGTSGYTYSVNAGAFSGTTSYASQAAGTYTVIVRDANACTFTANVTVANTPGPTAFAVSSVSSTCGNSNGIANAGAVTTSGSTVYQYSINGGALGATTSFTGLAAATYTLLVQDANGCQLTNTVVVTNLAGPTAQILTPTNATCGNPNGIVTIGATTGGNGLITYNFNGGAFSGTTSYSGLTAGTYTVIAQDANNCQFTQTTVVSDLAGPTAIALTPTNATCGGSNGAVNIGAVTGGSGTNTYSFNGSPFTATTSYPGLIAGTYTVIVQDVNLCQFTQTVAVNNSGGPSAVVVTPTNSTCGNPNGSIAIGAVTGGAGTINFSLNGGALSTTTSYTGLAAGTYTVLVSDVNACTFSQTVTVNNTAGPTAVVITPTNSTCGNANGVLAIGAVTGGTSGYTYSINGSAFTGTTSYTALLAGTYTIVVQDANNCQFTQTSDVLNIPGPTALVLTPTNSTCGNANGIVTLGAVTGGTSPYEYSLNNAPFVLTGPYTGLTASTYTVVIRDANLCTFTVTANVADTPGPTAQATSTTNSTCGNANGIVTAGATTGGTAPYQFSMDGGVLSATTTYTTTAGTHTVLVSDANLCTFTVTATVNNTAGPTAVALTSTPTNCGNSNGTIVVGAVTGGNAAYEYSIDGGVSYQATTTFLALSANTYTVTVRDVNLCTLTNTVVVSNLSSPVASVVTQTNVSCFGGNNGTVTLTGTGGATPYTYTLHTGQSNGSGVFNGLSAITYSLTITDAAGCNSASTFTVAQPAALVGSILNQTNTSCFSGSNGAVTITEAGGTGPFTYSLNGGAFGATPTFTGLSATDYTVTVQDGLGCTNNVPVTITQPTQVALTLTSANANCTDNNGTATVVATGGTPGYTYSWTGGGGSAATTVPVIAGDYTVTVLDANLCPRTGAVTIGVTPGGTATIASTTNVTCNGANNGILNVSMGGNSVGPFTYSWTPNVGTGATVNNLAPGAYAVVVTDSHGCIANTSGNISEPVVLAVNFTSTNVSCNAGSDGTISSTVTGGTAPYSYSWSPGAFNTGIVSGLPVGVYTLTVTDAQGCTVTGTRTIVEPTALTVTPTIVDPHCQQSDGSATVVGGGGAGGYTFSLNGGAFGAGSFNSLAAGTYTVTIRDGNQCTSNQPISLVDQAGPVATITASTNVSCKDGNNGSATVTATGGVTPYFYTWNPTSQTTQTANNLLAGVYGVTVTDASGCSASASIIITEPSQLLINATGVDPVCNGQSNGTGSSSAFGGTQPYSYQWQVLPVQNNANAINLAPGMHNVTVTDAQGCTATTSINLNNPPLLTVAITRTNLLCYQVCTGAALATTTNGTAPFLYSWNDANNQTSQTATGLCAGAYTVNVVDFKGCTAVATTTITEPTLLTSAIVNPMDVRCNGDCNGSGAVTATGGTGAYTYSWTNAATTAVNTNLCAGTYTATVTDANGCETQSVLSINTPNPLVITATKTNASCYNVCDGTATVSYVGGTAPYDFLWQPSLSQVFNPTALCDGVHSVVVTDANGCSQNASVTITEPTQLLVTTQVTGNNFCGQSNGIALAQVAGGTSPFNFVWSNGANTALNSNLAGGVYSVDVTDANGCLVNAIANVNDIPAPVLNLVTSQDIKCFGQNDGIGVISSSGGTAPIVYTWLMPSNLIPNPDQSGNGLWPGNNVYQAVDAAGCISSITVSILEPTQLMSLIPSVMVSNVSCNGANDGNATMLVNGGRVPYTYNWTGPTSITVPTATNLAAGSYTCNVVDSSGCATSASVTITQPDRIIITPTTVTQIDCYGNSNGAISVAITGGTPAYVYNWSPNVGSGPSVSSLDPGTYQLSLVDANGCQEIMPFTITQPDSLMTIVTTIPSKCSNPNASINVLVTGGTPIYTYQWNDLMLQTSSQASNLAAPAIYSCVITDGHGCIKNISVPVADLPPPTIDSISVDHVSCYNYTNGTATVYPKEGGSSVFTYAWYNSSNTLVGNGNFQGGLPIGTYQIVVTDANGCTVTGATTITQPFPLSVSVSQDQIACNGQTLGIYASAAGGTPLYNYTWSGAGTGLVNGGNHNVLFTNTNTTSTIQTYSVAVTDANNCPAVSGQFIVTVLPKISVLSNDVTGCLGENVTLEAIAGGGDGVPYTFTWGTSPTQVQTGSNSTISVPVTSNFPVSYNLTVSDGCSTQETIIVNVSSNPKPSASMIGINTQGCADLTVSFSGSGGSTFPNCTYSWSFGDGSAGTDSTTTHTYTSTGLQVDSMDVQMIVTTALGCSDTVIANNYIVVYPNPIAEFSYNPTEISEFEPTVNFYNESLLGSTFNWNFGDVTSITNVSTDENPIHVYNDPGTYDVNLIVTSALGCRDTITHSLYVTPEFALYVPNAFSPTGDFKNEIFTPQGIGIDEERYNMYIYNRWGELIYETNNFAKGWDGKIDGNVVQIDTYVYKIIVYDLRSEKHTLTGHVTVVR
jgi:gliding motility-associated-like protein